jgi:hypothetical protein
MKRPLIPVLSALLAATTPGQPCLVPVRMAFGQTMLELTCTPLE